MEVSVAQTPLGRAVSLVVNRVVAFAVVLAVELVVVVEELAEGFDECMAG